MKSDTCFAAYFSLTINSQRRAYIIYTVQLENKGFPSIVRLELDKSFHVHFHINNSISALF